MDYLAKNHGNKIIYFAVLSIVIVVAIVVWFFFIVPTNRKAGLNEAVPVIQGGPRVTLTPEEVIQKNAVMQALASEKATNLSKEEMLQKNKIIESLVKER